MVSLLLTRLEVVELVEHEELLLRPIAATTNLTKLPLLCAI